MIFECSGRMVGLSLLGRLFPKQTLQENKDRLLALGLNSRPLGCRKLVLLCLQDFCDEYPAYLSVEAVKRHPDRFTCWISLPLHSFDLVRYRFISFMQSLRHETTCTYETPCMLQRVSNLGKSFTRVQLMSILEWQATPFHFATARVDILSSAAAGLSLSKGEERSTLHTPTNLSKVRSCSPPQNLTLLYNQ